jgi:hypothetical protein
MKIELTLGEIWVVGSEGDGFFVARYKQMVGIEK